MKKIVKKLSLKTEVVSLLTKTQMTAINGMAAYTDDFTGYCNGTTDDDICNPTVSVLTDNCAPIQTLIIE